MFDWKNDSSVSLLKEISLNSLDLPVQNYTQSYICEINFADFAVKYNVNFLMTTADEKLFGLLYTSDSSSLSDTFLRWNMYPKISDISVSSNSTSYDLSNCVICFDRSRNTFVDFPFDSRFSIHQNCLTDLQTHLTEVLTENYSVIVAKTI